MMHHYRLNGHTPVPCTLEEWARGNREDRRVAATAKDGVSVSTVFLGLSHNFGDGPPLLFETMIFGGPHDEYQTRCSTWDEAQQMHAAACHLAFGISPYPVAIARLAQALDTVQPADPSV